MSTVNDTDLLLVERNGTQYQITIDEMSTLNDDDLLLVERGGVQYKIEAQYVSTGPNGLILPPVEVLTPVNGAGLNEGDSLSPISSAYVSTDSTPIYYRHFPEQITTVSGGAWVNENLGFNGQTSQYAELTGASGVVSQMYFTPQAGWVDGETTVYCYAAGGGSVEVLDENLAVLRTYSLPTTAGNSVSVGIVRANNRIQFTTQSQYTTLYFSGISGAVNDYIINGRVAFEFTDDTNLDKMVAPIIMTDENGDIKVPTTSTVDSTTTIPGGEKGWNYSFVGNGSPKTIDSPTGNRMLWIKNNYGYPGIIASNNLNGRVLPTDSNGAQIGNSTTLQFNEGSTTFATADHFNRTGVASYAFEIGEAPHVLDIVSWVGDSSNLREIPHNLGTKPGMIIIKRLDGSPGNFVVWHKDIAAGGDIYLNRSDRQRNTSTVYESEPTKDAFYVSDNRDANQSGSSYVAYVFAADTANKVKCGTYEGSYYTKDIDTGFKAGFFLTKCITQDYDWTATTTQASASQLRWSPNTSSSMGGNSSYHINLNNPTYVRLTGSSTGYNTHNEPYIYLAVADDLLGPNSTQLNLLSGQDLEYFTTGTQITSNLAASGSNISFGSHILTGNNSSTAAVNPTVSGQYFMDIQTPTSNKWLIWAKCITNSNEHRLYDSENNLLSYLTTSNNYKSIISSQGIMGPNNENGYLVGSTPALNNGGDNYVYWNFLAAPQSFDVQKYVGDGGYQTIQHNLGVEPGFIIIKSLSKNDDWICYHSELGFSRFFELNKGGYANSGSNRVRGATDADFEVGPLSSVNMNGEDYIAYLFAKDTPYMKCGKYTGNDATQFVDIGFKPRWIMIKSVNNSFRWVIHDKNMPNQYISPNENNSQRTLQFQFVANGININNAGGPNNKAGDEYIYIAVADESEGHPPSLPSSTTVTETPDPASATMVVNAESFDVGDSASAPALHASITSVGGSEGNKLFVDGSTGTWLPGLYAKGTEITLDAPSPDEIVFTSRNQSTVAFSGVDATLSSRTWTLESGPSATGPWTVVDSYVDYDAMNSQDGSTPWTTNKPDLAANTFYRIKVKYDSTNAESVESVYHTFKTGAS